MSSPMETQLIHDLRELAAGEPFRPNLEAIAVRARQRHRRGLMLRGATAAGAAVIAAGGLFTAVHGVEGTAATTAAGNSATSAGPAGRTETVAFVTAQVKSALADVNNYVLRTDQVQTGPGGDSATNWTDPRTSNDYEILNGSNGKSVAWLSTYLVNRVLTWKVVQADYSTRTWFVDVFHAAGPIQGSTAGATSTVMTPQEIKGWLDSGKLKIIGHREINGHQAIGLRQPWARGYRELWVDSQTFLPVRTVMADFANTDTPMKNVQVIGNESWLPRTQSLLDKLNQVQVPAGFKKVAPPQ